MTAVPMHCRGSFQPPHPSTVWSPYCTFSTVQTLDRVGRAHSWSHIGWCGVYVCVCVYEHHEQNWAVRIQLCIQSSLSPLSLYSANYSHGVLTARARRPMRGLMGVGYWQHPRPVPTAPLAPVLPLPLPPAPCGYTLPEGLGPEVGFAVWS